MKTMNMEVIFDKETKLRYFIEHCASKASGYYFIPMYFEITSDGEIVAHHLKVIPEDLKKLLIGDLIELEK